MSETKYPLGFSQEDIDDSKFMLSQLKRGEALTGKGSARSLRQGNRQIGDRDLHGGPYDRGRADSYYRRSQKPHYYPNGTNSHPIILKEFMTVTQVNDYNDGYVDNELNGDFKDWGHHGYNF